jgi:hypothetical protein
MELFSGEIQDSKKVFCKQKKIITITAAMKGGLFGVSFKKFNILPLASKFLL